MSLREKLRQRIKERREQLASKPQRRLAYELVTECRDCAFAWQCRLKMGARLRDLEENGSTRFDPYTIILIIQLAIAVWRFVKEMGWLSEATTEAIVAEVERD